MEKAFEIFETWFKMQREFIDTWTAMQKTYVDTVMDAAKKWQDTFLKAGAGPESPSGRQTLNMYEDWLAAVLSSSRTFADEAIKLQEMWKSTAERQMNTGREILSNLSAEKAPAGG